SLFCSMILRRPTSPLFPYTTLFRSDVALPEDLVRLHAGVPHARLVQRTGDALEVRLVVAGQGDVIEAYTVGTEAVSGLCLASGGDDGEDRTAGGEQEDRRCFHQHREPEQVDIEIATATQVRRAQSDVVHASCVKSYRHLKPPGTTPIMEPCR